MELFTSRDSASRYAYRSVSKEEQKNQIQRFVEVFGPVMLENGFIKKGSSFYRLYGKGFLQTVGLYREHFGPGHLYIGCIAEYPFGSYAEWLRLEGTGKWIHYERAHSKALDRVYLEEFAGEGLTPEFRWDGYTFDAPFLENRALYRVKDFEEAIRLEYELFVRKALPELNRIKDLDSYQAMRRRVYSPQTHGRFFHCRENSPYSYDRFYSMLEEEEWEKAEVCLRHMVEKTKEEVAKCQDALQKKLISEGLEACRIEKCDLEYWRDQLEYEEELLKRVMQRDAAWREQFMGRIQELTYAELNRLSPRILKNPVKVL